MQKWYTCRLPCIKKKKKLLLQKINKSKSKSLQIYFILTNFAACEKKTWIYMYMYGIWYVPLTCVTALVDRRPPFRTHPPEYCPGTGNRSVGGPDTGWSSTNPHTDKTSAFKAYKHRQLNVLHVNFLWKWHFNTWFYFEIFSNEFHMKTFDV